MVMFIITIVKLCHQEFCSSYIVARRRYQGSIEDVLQMQGHISFCPSLFSGPLHSSAFPLNLFSPSASKFTLQKLQFCSFSFFAVSTTLIYSVGHSTHDTSLMSSGRSKSNLCQPFLPIKGFLSHSYPSSTLFPSLI